MWSKKMIDNLVCWTTRKADTLNIIKDQQEVCDMYNEIDSEGLDRIYLSENPSLYYKTIENKIKILPSNVYTVKEINHCEYLVETELQHKDTFIEMSVTSEIEKDFNTFTNSRELYKRLKMPFRRGIMIFGPPGTGKTFMVHNLMKRVIEDDMIVIISNTALNTSITKALKDDNRLKVLVFEEFTNVLGQDQTVSAETLDFLDGASTLDNTFIIATTNYPERLPPNIVERPGRFDKFYQVDYLKRVDIEKYLLHYNIEPEECILQKQDLTIAMLKEIILLTLREGLTFMTALSRLEYHIALARNEFTPVRNKTGF